MRAINPGKSADQRGAVSIFTVVMFAILLSIISVGFVRLMIDEQQQTLKDALSKSAYNAAQAGIEDAKRAMLRCASITNPIDRTSCELQLYNPTCPGFNAVPNPASASINVFESIGIPASTSSGTSVGDDETAQGYSCVIITPDTGDLDGNLTVDSPNDSVMYELATTSVFNTVQIEWHPHVPTDLKSQGSLAAAPGGNPRKVGAGQWGNAPAALRLTLIKAPANGITLDASPTTIINSTFVYPVSTASAPSIPFTAPLQRYFTQCTNPNPALGQNYACKVNISAVPDISAKYYLILKPLYKSATYRITANNSGVPVNFDNVQPSIDSTGYTSGVYRRVQAQVTLGSDVVPHSSGIEAGEGICKDFIVGTINATFSDLCDY